MKFRALFTLVLLLSLLFWIDISRTNPVPAPPTLHISIDRDGIVTPDTLAIQRVGNVYTFKSDLTNASVEVQCDNIIIDGAGFTLQGNGETGIILTNRSNVIIRNLHIIDYVYSISLSESSNIIILNNQMLTAWNLILDSSCSNQIVGNNITGREPEFGYCIRFKNNSSNNTIVGNNFIDAGSAVWISGKNNTFYHNNFLSNKNNVVGSSSNLDNLWDNGNEGNFWSNYRGSDRNSNGIGDEPYIIDDDNRQDRYPLMAPIDIDNITFELPEWGNNSAAESSWTTKTSMPQEIGNLEAVVLEGKIFVIAADVTYEYNTSADTWITRKPMPTPRNEFGIAVVENKIYAIGGYTDDDYVMGSGVNEVYDPTTDTWETKTSMPTSRWLLDANAVSNKIYLIGGIGGRNVTEVYDPATDSWSTKTSPLMPIDDYASAVLDDKIYIIGGHEGGGSFTNRVQIYDPESDSWSYGQPAPQKIVFGTAGVTSGVLAPKRIYALGISEYVGIGVDFGRNVPPVINQVFDPENNSWTVGSSPSINRLEMAIAVVDDQLYAIGGYTYESSGIHVPHEPSAINEEYTPIGYHLPTETQVPTKETERLTITFVVAGTIAAIVATGLIVYFKKHHAIKLQTVRFLNHQNNGDIHE